MSRKYQSQYRVVNTIGDYMSLNNAGRFVANGWNTETEAEVAMEMIYRELAIMVAQGWIAVVPELRIVKR